MNSKKLALALSGALASFAALAGCGSDEAPETPAACVAPAATYLAALDAAPGEVRLGGTTAISLCIVKEQEPGSLASVGESVVGAATELNSEILRLRDQPSADATAELERKAVRLGYLVGAVQKAAAATGGIHRDLILRLDTAARYAGPGGKPFSAEVERAIGLGYNAGQETG